MPVQYITPERVHAITVERMSSKLLDHMLSMYNDNYDTYIHLFSISDDRYELEFEFYEKSRDRCFYLRDTEGVKYYQDLINKYHCSSDEEYVDRYLTCYTRLYGPFNLTDESLIMAIILERENRRIANNM
jgi:hypothetical protein